MLCYECEELEVTCSMCLEEKREELRRRISAERKRRHAFGVSAKAAKRLKLCNCCTEVSRAAMYKKCPSDMYVGHILTATKGGEHCVKNLRYYPCGKPLAGSIIT